VTSPAAANSLQPHYHSPLTYGPISSVHPTHLTPREERQRNDNHDTTTQHCIRRSIRPIRPATAIWCCAFMAGTTTRSQQMARDKDTLKNFLAWYIQEFGFNINATTALHDVQMLKDAKTLSELDDETSARQSVKRPASQLPRLPRPN
jgi:hypothetical protein